jgi:hypothetical protein
MSDAADVVNAIANATNWDARVGLIRRIPEAFGTAEHADIYAAIARLVYVPKLTPEFAYVHWRDEYELAPLERVYELALEGTQRFVNVSRENLAAVLTQSPTTLRVFRLLLGLTSTEFAEACSIVAEQLSLHPVSKSSVKSAEENGRIRDDAATTCAALIDMAMKRELFPSEGGIRAVRLKIEKPDTASGWDSVREFASN